MGMDRRRHRHIFFLVVRGFGEVEVVAKAQVVGESKISKSERMVAVDSGLVSLLFWNQDNLKWQVTERMPAPTLVVVELILLFRTPPRI